jgi:hypothetical protein
MLQICKYPENIAGSRDLPAYRSVTAPAASGGVKSGRRLMQAKCYGIVNSRDNGEYRERGAF